jgi:hypothetical protein
MSAARSYPPIQVPGLTRDDRPPVPETVKETGLSGEFITDLIIKTLYVQGARTGQQLMEVVRLPYPFVDDRLLDLQQRRLAEVRGTSGHSRAGYIFDLTGAGRERARDALTANQYVGPAPVPLVQYREWTLRQSISHATVTRDMVREGFRALVLEDAMLEMLGRSTPPSRSSCTARPATARPSSPRPSPGCSAGRSSSPMPSKWTARSCSSSIPSTTTRSRWRRRRWPVERLGGVARRWGPRPALRPRGPARRLIGGELTLDQLDLQYDQFTKMYQAPFQLKSNGGVLILDDFGRQRVPPRDLLNRWIVPLEKRIDFLSLHTGGKFPVPFDTLLIFATNLAPTELVEEAFLRRIHYKIHVLGPDPEEYREIFRRCCQERGITYQESAVEYIYSRYYERLGIQPRACHPRDLLDHLLDISRFLEVEHRLTTDLLDRACQSYFLDEMTVET